MVQLLLFANAALQIKLAADHRGQKGRCGSALLKER